MNIRRVSVLMIVVAALVGIAVLPAGAVVDTQPPVVTFVPNPLTPPPSPTGWYRDLSPFGTLPYVVNFVDPSGLATVECHGLLEFSYGPPVLLGTTFGYSAGVAADGRYTLDCRASDQLGNAGVGDGSTAMPIELRIDRTAPTVTCPRHRLAHQGRLAWLRALVQDATSGPARQRVSVPLDTSKLGVSEVAVTAHDVAGNTTTTNCTYLVRR